MRRSATLVAALPRESVAAVRQGVLVSARVPAVSLGRRAFIRAAPGVHLRTAASCPRAAGVLCPPPPPPPPPPAPSRPAMLWALRTQSGQVCVWIPQAQRLCTEPSASWAAPAGVSGCACAACVMMHRLLVCLGCVLSCAQQRLSRPSLRNGWAWCAPRGARAHLHYWPDPSENDGDEQPSLALVQGRAAAPKRPIVPLPAQRAAHTPSGSSSDGGGLLNVGAGGGRVRPGHSTVGSRGAG